MIARFPAPAGRPTVCLYAHHDVQPEGDPAAVDDRRRSSRRRRGERLYGRGAADDKGGFAVHLAALRAFDGEPPVGVTAVRRGRGGDRLADAGPAARRAPRRAGRRRVRHRRLGQLGRSATRRSPPRCAAWPTAWSRSRTLDHARALGHVRRRRAGRADHAVPAARDPARRTGQRGRRRAGRAAEPADLDYPADRLRGRVRPARRGRLDRRRQRCATGCGPSPRSRSIALDTTPVEPGVQHPDPVSARAKISLRVAPGDDAERALGH